jgi:cobalamin biosynthesis protein CobT
MGKPSKKKVYMDDEADDSDDSSDSSDSSESYNPLSDEKEREEIEEEDEEEGGEEEEEEEEEDDEEEQEQEEEVQDEIDEEEQKNAEMARIIDSINELSESETGNCKSNNKSFLYVIEATNKIRCNLDNYEKLKEDMKAFTEDENILNAFTDFKGIAEFVMDIHKRYHVKLNETTENIDLVLDMIRNILGKYTDRFPNIQNNTLTSPPQCTTVS